MHTVAGKAQGTPRTVSTHSAVFIPPPAASNNGKECERSRRPYAQRLPRPDLAHGEGEAVWKECASTSKSLVAPFPVSHPVPPEIRRAGRGAGRMWGACTQRTRDRSPAKAPV